MKLLSYVKGAWVQFPLDFTAFVKVCQRRCHLGQGKNMRIPVERKETGKPGDFDNMTVDELKAFIQANLDSKPATDDRNDTEPLSGLTMAMSQ